MSERSTMTWGSGRHETGNGLVVPVEERKQNVRGRNLTGFSLNRLLERFLKQRHENKTLGQREDSPKDFAQS